MATQILVRVPEAGGSLGLVLAATHDITVGELRARIARELGCSSPADLRVTTIGGLELGCGSNNDRDPAFACDDSFRQVMACRRVCGGKGGFGSMLRSQGGKMSSKKITNFDSCRDLSGRRLKTAKAAQGVEELLNVEEQEALRRKQLRRKKIEEGLKERPAKKHHFDDLNYIKESEAIAESTKSDTRKAMKRLLHDSKKRHQQGSSSPSSEETLVQGVAPDPVKFVGAWGDEIPETLTSSEDESDDEDTATGQDAEEDKEAQEIKGHDKPSIASSRKRQSPTSGKPSKSKSKSRSKSKN
ncbi:hypothetical protein EV182_000961 [Spiromyces aspiralis]|uniref:Uncharacterized protein n=1 Tax=Spiromyces aspiralis TaxID=68401 RepID=A0ACC1HK28_9FUNG|nr:hypothetical protein EV182_000961 [Spiromyces aspiralis]